MTISIIRGAFRSYSRPYYMNVHSALPSPLLGYVPRGASASKCARSKEYSANVSCSSIALMCISLTFLPKMVLAS